MRRTFSKFFCKYDILTLLCRTVFGRMVHVLDGSVNCVWGLSFSFPGVSRGTCWPGVRRGSRRPPPSATYWALRWAVKWACVWLTSENSRVPGYSMWEVSLVMDRLCNDCHQIHHQCSAMMLKVSRGVLGKKPQWNSKGRLRVVMQVEDHSPKSWQHASSWSRGQAVCKDTRTCSRVQAVLWETRKSVPQDQTVSQPIFSRGVLWKVDQSVGTSTCPAAPSGRLQVASLFQRISL